MSDGGVVIARANIIDYGRNASSSNILVNYLDALKSVIGPEVVSASVYVSWVSPTMLQEHKLEPWILEHVETKDGFSVYVHRMRFGSLLYEFHFTILGGKTVTLREIFEVEDKLLRWSVYDELAWHAGSLLKGE